MQLDPTVRFSPRTSPAELLALAVGGGDEVIDDSSFELGAFLCACPDLELYGALGQGGMGVVYRARQVRLDRNVAVKLMKPELAADPEFSERFEREAKALARLDHPGIVRVHDFGLAGDVFYLVMELVDGPNLRQLIDVGMEEHQAVEVISQLCDALAYAHDEGVVHRDIKPENVLIDRRGRVKVADFGLAKLARDEGDLARTRRVMGTLHYMAPEQMRDPAGVDARCDIFSIGVVSYEMLTGQLPVGRFPAPSEVGGGNVALDEVVLRALESDRSRRYAGASELAAALSSASEPTQLGGGSYARRTRWAWAAAAATAVGVGVLWAATRVDPPTPEPTLSLTTAVESATTTTAGEVPIPSSAEPSPTTVSPPPALNVNRWPAKELASLDPDIVAVVGLDWGELRQAPLVHQITASAFDGVPEALTPCAELFAEHAYKGLAAFSEDGFEELVVHGDWSAALVQPCIEALGPAIRPVASDAASADAVSFHQLEIETQDKEGKHLARLAFDRDTLVVSMRTADDPAALAAKLAGEETSTALRDRVMGAVDLRKPLWAYVAPEPGVLPQNMLTAQGEVEVWDSIALSAAARFTDADAAAEAKKLGDSYLTILTAVPELSVLRDFAVTREGDTVRLQGSGALDSSLITSLSALDLSDEEAPTAPFIRVQVGDAPPERPSPSR